MAAAMTKKEQKAEYANFKGILLAELDRINASEECDIHRAFVHETARVFSSTASGFSLTDGKNEWGIDFCRADAPIFTIAQCKCPQRPDIEGSDRPRSYDRDALEDLLTGITYVRDVENTYPGATLDLKQFKNSYHESLREWKKETRLQAALAIFGELTPQADNYFKNRRNTLEKDGVELLLWDWSKFNDLLTTPQIDIDNMRLTFEIEDPSKEILKRSTPVCFVRGIDLINAWHSYQWNLVDWNVRAEIKSSPTNKRIQDTLSSPSGRRHFQDYNNGLLVVCKQITYKDVPGNKMLVTLKQPQVVNGCQTLLSLVRAYLDLSEKDKEDFTSHVRVQLKIIQNQPLEYVERIIQSTNDQNPMSSRSLKANTIEQKRLQECFAKWRQKYFYERKDGQFEGLLNFGQKSPSFRPSDYQISGKKKYRLLNNEDLAHEWLAFIGYSDEILRGGIKLFDSDNLYKRAFLAHPCREYWERLQMSPATAPPVQDDNLFEDGSPGVAQYLLAHVTASIIKQRKVSFQRNRTAAIERLVKSGKIAAKSSGRPAEDTTAIEGLLSKDDEYLLGTILNNMHDVLVELYAMILCYRYGPLDEARCTEILSWPPIQRHVENPFMDIPTDASEHAQRHVLNLIYEFLRFALQQYVIRYGDVIRAQPRLKSYLAQRNTIDRIRAFILEVDEEKVPKWVDAWCSGRLPFTKQLPDLQKR